MFEYDAEHDQALQRYHAESNRIAVLSEFLERVPNVLKYAHEMHWSVLETEVHDAAVMAAKTLCALAARPFPEGSQ